MTKVLALAAVFAATTFLTGCDGGAPDSTAESTPAATEQTDTATTGTTETTDDAAKPAATE